MLVTTLTYLPYALCRLLFTSQDQFEHLLGYTHTPLMALMFFTDAKTMLFVKVASWI